MLKFKSLNFRRKIMKIRILSLFMALLLICSLAIVGCNSSNKENETNESTASESSTQTNGTENNDTENKETESSTEKVTGSTPEGEEIATGYKVTVVDENGNPLADAEVQLCIVGGLCLMPDFTALDGSVFFDASPADYEVTVRLDGYVTAEHVAFPAGSTNLVVTMVAEPSGYTVKVVDEEGNPLAGAEVQLCVIGGMCLLPDFTGADGSVTIDAGENTYNVTVRLDGYVTAEYVPFPEGSTEVTIILVKE